MTPLNPPWPGEPQAHGFSQNPEDDSNDWVYTSWKDKMWFCTVYNGQVDVNNLRKKEDVARVIFINNLIEGIIDSPIFERTEFFFDSKNSICGVEVDYKPTEEGMPVEYLMYSKVSFYKKCLEYLVREE